MNEIQLGEFPFPDAAELWLEAHKRYIKPNTIKNYRASLKPLLASLGDTIVKDIHIGHLRAYQDAGSRV